MNDWSELKRLAEAATPGPWSAGGNDLYWNEDGYTRHLMETDDGSDICHDAEHPANLAFIAAANPAAVLALIAENERLEGALHGASKEIHGLSVQHGRDSAELRRLCQARDDIRKERDQLKAENEALRLDAERVASMAPSLIRDTYNEAYYAPREIGSDAEQIRAGVLAVLRAAKEARS